MTNEDFEKTKEKVNRILLKYLLGAVLFFAFYALFIFLFDKVLDHFYPLRSEENPIPFPVYLFSMLVMFSPLYIGIKLITPSVRKTSEYFSTLRAYQPIQYDVRLLHEVHVIERLTRQGYEEGKAFVSSGFVVRRFEKQIKGRPTDCILLFRPEVFTLAMFQQLLADFEEKKFLKMTCKIFVVAQSSNQETQNSFAFEINTMSVPVHVTLYDLETNRFYFKLPFAMEQNRSTASIADFKFIYDLFVGIPYKQVKQMHKKQDSN